MPGIQFRPDLPKQLLDPFGVWLGHVFREVQRERKHSLHLSELRGRFGRNARLPCHFFLLQNGSRHLPSGTLRSLRLATHRLTPRDNQSPAVGATDAQEPSLQGRFWRAHSAQGPDAKIELLSGVRAHRKRPGFFCNVGASRRGFQLRAGVLEPMRVEDGTKSIAPLISRARKAVADLRGLVNALLIPHGPPTLLGQMWSQPCESEARERPPHAAITSPRMASSDLPVQPISTRSEEGLLRHFMLDASRTFTMGTTGQLLPILSTTRTLQEPIRGLESLDEFQRDFEAAISQLNTAITPLEPLTACISSTVLCFYKEQHQAQ